MTIPIGPEGDNVAFQKPVPIFQFMAEQIIHFHAFSVFPVSSTNCIRDIAPGKTWRDSDFVVIDGTVVYHDSRPRDV
jgi:hypothetical protein